MSRILEEMMINRSKLVTGAGSYVIDNGDYKVLMVPTTPEQEAEQLLKERLLREPINSNINKVITEDEGKKIDEINKLDERKVAIVGKRKYTKRKKK